jgi:uncharacterized protein (DUF433 family)
VAETNVERLYGEIDPRDRPRYGVTEAARCLKIPLATLRSWMVGTTYSGGIFHQVLTPAATHPLQFSFHNLVEAHVLRALRSGHLDGRNRVQLPAIREAIAIAGRLLNVDRLLLSDELRTGAGELLIEQLGELVNLNRAGQIGMKRILNDYLDRIEWQTDKLIRRLYPYDPNNAKVIAIDPLISFGKPTITSCSVSTAVIAKRLNAGESVSTLAEDYDISVDEIEVAAAYEIAA